MRRFRNAACGLIAMTAAVFMSIAFARAQDAGSAPAAPPRGVPAGGPPPTMIAPETAPEAAPPSRPAAPAPARKSTHAASRRAGAGHFDIEEANARLQLSRDTAVYASPSTGAHQLEQGTAGKYIQATGVTRHWLRVKLKSGATGYVQQKDVRMLKPADKYFVLTRDAAVRADPNPWAKQVSQVHRGRNVHVIGIAINYAKIRMKSGLEGYIPLTALE